MKIELNRARRTGLMVSVSALTILIASERGLEAQANEWWMSVEGQYLLFEDDGSFGGPVPDDGWGGAVEVGLKPAGSDYSFVSRLRYGEGDGSQNAYGYGGNFNRSEEEHLIADLEIGRDIGIGSADVRLHAGLRFAYMSSETNYGFGTYTSDSDFVGIGPRIGLDAKAPLSGNLSAEMKVAGAVLFGKRDAEAVYGGAYTYNYDDNDVVVPNLEGSVGLNYLFGENMSAAIGYRADAYWNVIDTGNGDGSRLIHGPFARFTVNFGGGN